MPPPLLGVATDSACLPRGVRRLIGSLTASGMAAAAAAACGTSPPTPVASISIFEPPPIGATKGERERRAERRRREGGEKSKRRGKREAGLRSQWWRAERAAAQSVVDSNQLALQFHACSRQEVESCVGRFATGAADEGGPIGLPFPPHCSSLHSPGFACSVPSLTSLTPHTLRLDLQLHAKAMEHRAARHTAAAAGSEQERKKSPAEQSPTHR